MTIKNKTIFRYFKSTITFLVVVLLLITIGGLNGSVMKNSRADFDKNWNSEGPYVFFENDSIMSINYIKRNKENGIDLNTITVKKDSLAEVKCYYQIDTTNFSFKLNTYFETPKTTYSDSKKIMVISDIESNYKIFRDFLINNNVIDSNLNWTFGKNHLVLVGDFIDRYYFTTQVLWFIYKLEQDAKEQGGNVHYILGNHEIMNMQGDHRYAKPKYNYIASVLGKKQIQLYDKNSFIGRWLESKNTLEVINGNLFVHAGISPEFRKIDLNIDKINQRIRDNYYKVYSPDENGDETLESIISSEVSPYWYRGYFKDNLSQKEVNKGIEKFNAKTVIVGHTIQKKVNRKYKGKVIGIDVKHKRGFLEKSFKYKTEGLLIENNKYYRVFENGKTKELR